MTKSVSATIDSLLSLRADADRRANELDKQRVALDREYRERMATLEREMAVARAEAAAYGHALELVEPLTGEPRDTFGQATVRHVGRRKRGMSPLWRNCFSGMPVAPAPSVPVQQVYAIVHKIDPNIPVNNVRSQLNAAKVRGDVEWVDGGWRLTRPLDALAAHENEASRDDASDTEGSEADAPEPSESNHPQRPWLTADAAD